MMRIFKDSRATRNHPFIDPGDILIVVRVVESEQFFTTINLTKYRVTTHNEYFLKEYAEKIKDLVEERKKEKEMPDIAEKS